MPETIRVRSGEVTIEAVTRWAWTCPDCGEFHDEHDFGFVKLGEEIECLDCGGWFVVTKVPR